MASGTFEAAGDVSGVLQIQPNEVVTVVLTDDAAEAWAVILEEIVAGGNAYETLAIFAADTAGTEYINQTTHAQRVRLRCTVLDASDTVDYEITADVVEAAPASLDTFDEVAAAVADLQADIVTYAPLASPALTGNPTVPTQSAGNSTTRAASTAFVQQELSKQAECLIIAASDETTALTTGNGKATFRMPFAMTLTSVKASLTTASSSGAPSIDVNDGGTTIFSTPLTIDQDETTSATATTPAVLSDTALAADAEIRIDIDTAGTGAAGLKVYLIGTRT